MSLAAEAEKRRDFEPEILTHSDITTVQDGIKKNTMCMKPECCTPQEKR